MDAKRYQRIKELFQTALELEPGRRAAFLDEACKGEPYLRAEVEALLEDEALGDELMSPGAALERPAGGLGDRLLGTRVGQYHLRSVISGGGMGTVYEALQEKPRRIVAVKVMREGITSKSALRRFEYESQILARLRHSGIAQVYEAGTHVLSPPDNHGETMSVPYFVMEYIANARSITEYVHDLNLTTLEKLKLFMQVCEAVHYGHQKGIIHRDLKPANILVDANGHIKIIDFGVARATDSDMALTTLQTEVGQLIGTLQYMSPEQCQADVHDLDIRSDVYSLGVVLYELLCRKLPYDVRKLSVYEAVQKIRDVQPVQPSTTLRILKGDVETIVLKALEKERVRRYQSADELMRDIDRYLKGESIMARPPSVIYQLRTFARRNKALVGGVLAVLLVLMAGVIVSTTLYYRAIQEAESAKAINAFFNDMLASIDPLRLNIVSGFIPEEKMKGRPSGGLSRDVSMAEMMRFATTKIEETFAGKPELEASVRETVGTTLIGLGLYQDAKAELEAALEIRRNHHGDDPLDTLRAQVQLAYIRKYTGDTGKAVALLRPAIDEMQRVFGEDHRNTLTCQCMLAAALYMEEEYEESNSLFRKTLDAQKRLQGDEHRDTLWTMTEWSYVLYVKLMNIESEKLAKDAYGISLRLYGEEDYITLFSGIVLAYNLLDRCDYQFTESMLRSLMETSARILGKSHRITIYARIGYAISLPCEGHLKEKETILGDAVAACRESLGERHFWTHRILVMLVNTLASTGKADEVERLYRDMLKRCQEELGEKAARTMEAMRLLAACLLNRGKFAEGRKKYEEWVDLNARTYGERHESTLTAMVSVAEALRYAGLRAEANAYSSRAISGWQQRVETAEAGAMDYIEYARCLLTCEPPGLRDPGKAVGLAMKAIDLSEEEDSYMLDTQALAHYLNGDTEKALKIQRKAVNLLPQSDRPLKRRPVEDHLILYLLRTGDIEGGKRCLDEIIAERLSRFSEGYLYLAGFLLEDAMLLIDACRYEMAEPRLRESLTIFEKSHIAQHAWKRQMARIGLGQCLAGRGRFEEAEAMLLEAFEGIKNHPMIPVRDQVMTMERIIKLYEDWGKPLEADEWRAKLH